MDGLISGLFWWIVVMGVTRLFWSIFVLINRQRGNKNGALR